MPRRQKKQQENYESVEYGMDDYDDPLEHMTPQEIKKLAKFISTMKDFNEPTDSEGEGELFVMNEDGYSEPPPFYPPTRQTKKKVDLNKSTSNLYFNKEEEEETDSDESDESEEEEDSDSEYFEEEEMTFK